MIILMMINVTLVAFYMELCRLRKTLCESNQVSSQYSKSLVSLRRIRIPFKLIKDHRVTRKDLFKGLRQFYANSFTLLVKV